MSGTDEVRGIIEHHLIEGNVVKDDRDMLGGILDIRNLVVGDIMTHRSKINSINITQPINDVMNFVSGCEHTRIPVWQNKPDNIIGILHIRDLMQAMQKMRDNLDEININDLLKEPCFISENVLVSTQLNAFQTGQRHLACVIDEYGELQGIVTLEDILEEIVGQIYDEYDIGDNKIAKISNKEYTIDGAVTIRNLNRELRWDIPECDANTIAGFLIHKMQRIPSKGESYIFGNLTIVVKAKSENRIKTVKILIND